MVPPVILQRVDDQLLLVAGKFRTGLIGLLDTGGLENVRRQVFGEQRITVGHEHRSFDHVLQFANIAGPMVTHEDVHRIRGDAEVRDITLAGGGLDERVDEDGNVLETLAQRRQADRKTLMR